MQNVLTVRLPPALRAKLEKRAAALRRPVAEHVRQVLKADLQEPQPKPSRFVCLNLKGCYAIGHGSNNAAMRRALAKQREENC